MAWFISPGIPSLAVKINDEKSIRFVNAEYRTADPEEIAALLAHPDCHDAAPEDKQGKPGETTVRVSPRPWAADRKNRIIHHMDKAGLLCDLPPGLYTEEFKPKKPWVYGNFRLYRRLSDARRWEKGSSMCPYCGSE